MASYFPQSASATRKYQEGNDFSGFLLREAFRHSDILVVILFAKRPVTALPGIGSHAVDWAPGSTAGPGEALSAALFVTALQ